MNASTHCIDPLRATAAPGWWRRWRSLWQQWRRRGRLRAELRALDARALADIGIDPEAAHQEGRKSFWQG